MIRIAIYSLVFALLTSCSATLFKTESHRSAITNSETVSVAETPEAKIDTIALGQCQFLDGPIDPESYNNAWDRISTQFSMLVPDNQRVRAQKSWYVNHPKYLSRVSKRAQPYLYFIIQQIEKRNLPLELALLPIVESAYDPFAYSHGRASGMWQFIPGTGKGYGLTQNWWFDGRRDVYLSTHAALDYLAYLNKHFKGNWLHALAAYNSGLGNVGRAIRNNKKQGKPTDFWSLKLPKETKAYVPKLLALADILSKAKPEESVWTAVANEPYFVRIPTESQIDLSLAADLSEQSMQEFYQLNPAFNHWATAPEGPHYLLFPIEKSETFSNNLSTIPLKERIAHKRYKIKPGDNLSSIAVKFSTTVKLLLTHNGIVNNQITAGKTLLIPVPSEKRTAYSKSNQQRLAAKHKTKRKGNRVSLKVKSGDSFWSLAKKHKVSVRNLASWNNMAPKDPLRIGQKLVLWSKVSSAKYAGLMNQQQKTKKIHYKVRNGDSFARIADKFNVSLNKIKNWNKSLSRKKYLQPGQSLTLFVDITNQL
ncbi:MAG: LysM peptidoglycan-binding domain-containing protein [Kangiellaceae bacterium]|nr:LysM peptidoglycan-binding domain-containing protein [Kangiellaceae bacterium]